jgi:hypothetical protein
LGERHHARHATRRQFHFLNGRQLHLFGAREPPPLGYSCMRRGVLQPECTAFAMARRLKRTPRDFS